MPFAPTTWNATGSYSDGTSRDVTSLASWTVSDATMMTIGAATATGSVQTAGHIWGATIGVTATVGSVVGTGSALVIASDSSSFGTPFRVHMPQYADHWQALGISPWGTWWGLQELTGNAVGSGSVVCALTGAGGINYGGTNVDWLRVGIGTSGTGEQYGLPAGVGGYNIANTSSAVLAYGIVWPSAAANGIVGLNLSTGGASRIYIQTDPARASSGQLGYNSLARTKAFVVGPNSARTDDRIHPFLHVYNKTTGESWMFTDEQLIMSGAMGAVTDAVKGLGAPTNSTAASASFVYMAMATGSIVEALCTPSGAADFLSRLGWNVSWKDCPTDSGTIKLPFLPMHWTQLGLPQWTVAYNFTEETGSIQNIEVWPGTLENGWQLTANQTILYRQPVTGWNRKGVTMFDGVLDARLLNSLGVFDGASASMAYLGYHVVTSVGATGRTLHGQGVGVAGTQFYVFMNPDGIPGVNCSGTLTSGTITHLDGRVHPTLIVYDKTNSRAKLYSDTEKVTGTFGAPFSSSAVLSKGIGGLATLRRPPSMTFLYWAAVTGSTAETLSDDGQASAFLKKLGWTIPW